MNKIKFLYFLIALLFLSSACNQTYLSSLSVKTSVASSSVVLRAGDTVELEIEAVLS